MRRKLKCLTWKEAKLFKVMEIRASSSTKTTWRWPTQEFFSVPKLSRIFRWSCRVLVAPHTPSHLITQQRVHELSPRNINLTRLLLPNISPRERESRSRSGKKQMQKTITREIRSKEITCSCNFPMPSSFFFQMKGKFMASFLSHHSDESLDRFSYFSSSLRMHEIQEWWISLSLLPRELSASLLRRIGENEGKKSEFSRVDFLSTILLESMSCDLCTPWKIKIFLVVVFISSPSLVSFSLASHVLVIQTLEKMKKVFSSFAMNYMYFSFFFSAIRI